MLDDKLNQRALLHKFIDEQCLFRCDPNIKYSNNLNSGHIHGDGPGSGHTYQYFMRKVTHNPRALAIISDMIVADIIHKIQKDEEYENIQLAGIETGSIPLMTGIQMSALKQGIIINGFSIRKTRKTYGLHNYIEGSINSFPVVLVDDIINSGISCRRAYDIIYNECSLKSAKNAYFILDFDEKRTHIQYKNDLITCNHVFRGNEFDTTYDNKKYWYPIDCKLKK